MQNREFLAYIKDQLRLHSIKVTVDIYGHLAPEGNKRAVNNFDDPALDRFTETAGENTNRLEDFYYYSNLKTAF